VSETPGVTREPVQSGPAGYTPELEALRGLAASLVLLFHVATLVRPGAPPPQGLFAPLLAFAHEGQTGVSLFFVLSAFLLSQPFLIGAQRGRAPGFRAFWIRRALRILPLYTLGVAVGTVLCAEAPSDLLHGLPYLVFLNVHGSWVTPLRPYSDVWWSLATEAQFYAVLPFAGWLAVSRPGRFALAAILALAAAVYAAFASQTLVMPSMASHYSVLFSLIGRGPVFLCGVAAAWLWLRFGGRIRDAAGRVPWLRSGGADAVLLLLMLALGVLLLRVGGMGFFVAEANWPVWHVYEGMLWAGFLLAVMLLPIRCRPLFARGPLVWIGTISYSLYLWHFPILFPLLSRYWEPSGRGPGWTPRTTAVALLGVALALGLSALSYRFVERPFLRRKARLAAADRSRPR
jgi:peptidoglycan/LPS O-acetylase OafA/YrhL